MLDFYLLELSRLTVSSSVQVIQPIQNEGGNSNDEPTNAPIVLIINIKDHDDDDLVGLDRI